MARQFDLKTFRLLRSSRLLSKSSGHAAAETKSAGPAGAGGGLPGSVPGKPSIPRKLQGAEQVSRLLQSYEDLVGIGDVKRAQSKVTQIEKYFMEVRENVKKSAQELHNVQSELRTIRAKLDRTPRDDAKFLEYATEEHLAIQKEKRMAEEHDTIEDIERSTFANLSIAVRESHEKQRSQEEKTKYRGIIGSILGTIIGILGSTIINQRRMGELKSMVGGDLQKDLQGFVADIQDAISGETSNAEALEKLSQRHQERLALQESHIDEMIHQQEAALLKEIDGVRKFTACELKSMVGDLQRDIQDTISGETPNAEALEKLSQRHQERLALQESHIDEMIHQQGAVLLKEIDGVRKFAARGGSGSDMSTLEELVSNAEQKLEWEMKMSTLSTVVFIYGAFALTLPILYSIFK